MNYQLNRKSLERLKALVRAGSFVDRAWSFSVEDSNQLLGTPNNWTEFQLWFLGIGVGVPPAGTTNPTDDQRTKDDFAYPFGKGDVVNLQALRAIASQAKAAGESDIATAATDVLADATAKLKDQASSKACDLDITFTSKVVDVKAAAAGSKIPTFDCDAYTGVAMTLEGFGHPVVIDFDGMDFTAHSRPVLRDHDPKRPIGHTTSIAVSGGILKAAGEISVVSPDSKEVIDSGKNKFPWQISVGMKVLKSQFIPEGDTAQANGKTWQGPTIIARQTSLREISFLTLGADDNTSARIAARAAKKGAIMALKKKFAAWAKARNIVMADMEDDGMASAFKSAYKAQMKCDADDPNDEDDDGKGDDKKDDKKANSAAAGVDIKAAAVTTGATGNVVIDAVTQIRAAAVTERQRMTAMNTVLDGFRSKVEPTVFATIEAKAIGGEYDQTRTELELIKASRPTVNAPMVNTGKGGEVEGGMIAAAAARSAGVSEKVAFKGLDERQSNIASSLKVHTIRGIIAMSAGRLGIHVPMDGIDDDFLMDFIRRDKESHRQQIRAGGNGGVIRASSSAGFSTMSLTGITENIMYKAMLEAYTLQVSVVPEIAFETDTNDFKIYKRYRLTGSGQFQPVGPSGEIKSMSLQDESYGNQVRTNAVLLVLTREIIINDDMGALMQAPQALGEEGAQNRESLVITAFLSGTTTVAPGASAGKAANNFNFWSAGAKNYLSGGTSPLSLTSLTTAVQKLQEQKNANGRPIGVPPKKILVSPAGRTVAEGLFNGINLIAAGYQLPSASAGTSAAQSASQSPDWNAHKGRYTPVVSPYLSAQFLGNDTQWALLPDPAGGKATVQVGYLRGQRTPIIKQVETDATMLGIAYQAIQDIGVALMDYRMGVYSAGQ